MQKKFLKIKFSVPIGVSPVPNAFQIVSFLSRDHVLAFSFVAEHILVPYKCWII